MMRDEYDVLIVGGGLSGASLACALASASSDMRIAMIESIDLSDAAVLAKDPRTVALSHGSRRIFEGLGLWEDIMAESPTPIHTIHVSDRGHFGLTVFDSEALGVDALGYVIGTKRLTTLLVQQLGTYPNVDLICPAKLDSMAVMPQRVEAAVRVGDDPSAQTVNCTLIVGADGAQSMVRQSVNVHCDTVDYHQLAVSANVATAEARRYTAFERFTPDGPFALLPIEANEQHAHRWSMIWTVKEAQRANVQAMDDSEALALIRETFGNRLGEFIDIERRGYFPLSLVRATDIVRSRAALIGNAAHTMSPIAGQGFNLGLRDVAVLAEVLTEAGRQQQDIGSLRVLRQYAAARKSDHKRITGLTDGLTHLYSNNYPAAAFGRNAGLSMMNLLPPLKSRFARETMGVAHRLSKLQRGLPL